MVESTSGSPAPRAAVAQGQVAYGCSPYHSVTPTGMVPSAITGSCSVSPTVTTRLGLGIDGRLAEIVFDGHRVRRPGGFRGGGGCGLGLVVAASGQAGAGDEAHEEGGEERAGAREIRH